MNEETILCPPVTTKSEIFKYGFGGATLNITYFVYSSYLIFFWTDYAGISAAAAGAIYFVGRLIMAVMDPICGIMVDHTSSKWGKCRPFLMVSTPIICILFFALFTDYPMGTSAKTALYAVLLIGFSAFAAIQTVAYEAQVPAMSTDLSKRNFVVMTRQVLGTSISVGCMAATIPMVNYFGGGLGGWHVTIAIFAVACAVFMLISLSGSKRHDVAPPKESVKAEKGAIWNNLKQVLSVKPVIFLVVTFGFIVMANEVTGATNMYIFKYAIKDENLFSIATFASLPANILAALLTPFLVAKFGKKQIFFVACLFALTRPLVLLIFRPFDNIPLIIALYVIAQFFMIMMVVDVWTMVADCVEYVALTKKISSAGLVTSCNTFMLDFGGAMAGIVVGGMLTLAGYLGTETVETISASTLNGIIFINAGIPAVLFVCACLIHRFYKITNKVLVDLGANVGNQVIK